MNKLLAFTCLFILLTLTTGSFSQGLIISSGSHMIVSEGNIIINENFTNNGNFTDNGGDCIFSGTTQTIGGTNPAVFNNVTIHSGSTTTINTSGQTLAGILLSDGTLIAGGKITLLSTATKTALVSGAGTGSITGNITLQRYLASGMGYKYISSPFQAATVNEFSDDLDLGAAFPTFYRYDENQDIQWWYDYTSSSNVMNPMAGYAANFGASLSAKTIDAEGEVSNGSMSVTLYNHNKTHTKGFNLVGNPYPSPINWDAASGWTKTNIDDAIYYFNAGSSDQYVGSYSSYINGVSSDEGFSNNIIPAFQGFFVHVSTGTYPVTGTLGFTNAVRVNSLTPNFHRTAPREDISLIRLTASFDGNENLKDPLVIITGAGGSQSFVKQDDAVKLLNTDPEIPSVYSVFKDEKYVIKSLPVPGDSLTIIPLGINLLKQGILNFRLQTLQNVDPGLHLYFSDAKRRAVVPFIESEPYRTFQEEGECNNRYALVFSRKEIQTNPGSDHELTAYYQEGKFYIYMNLLPGENADLLFTDVLGRIICEQVVSGVMGFYPVNMNLNSGLYIISMRTTHNTASKKIVIPE